MTIIQNTQMYYLLIYFIEYSILGWGMESLYRSLLDKKWINSGFMYGPYCPIYGFGTLIMILGLEQFKNNIILLFFMSFIILSFWEYIVAVWLEKMYHTKYWDYSNKKININGRVCLLNSIYWGILGVLFILFIHPFISSYTSKIQFRYICILDYVLSFIFLIDYIISSVHTHAIVSKIERIKELNEKIKEKLQEEVTLHDRVFIHNEKISIERLQLKYHRLRIRLYKQLRRLKKVFPTMQSEMINNFLDEKIDTNEIKEKICTIKSRVKELKKKVKNNTQK